MFFLRRKKVGLALGSGGARGLAHIGVIKALVANNIPIDYIAGTSVGSLIGGLYSGSQDINKVENLVNQLNYKQLLGVLFDPFSRSGIIKGNNMMNFLTKQVGSVKIEDLATPFRAIATDTVSGQTYVFDSGDLATAIRASSSIPIVFSPVKLGERVLVDGGTSVPIPTDIVRSMGADIVISVNLYSKLFPKKIASADSSLNWGAVANSSVYLMIYHLAKMNLKNADIVVEPYIPNLNPLNFVEAKQFVDYGQLAAEAQMDVIKKLIR